MVWEHNTPSLGWSLALMCFWHPVSLVRVNCVFLVCARGKCYLNTVRPDPLPVLCLYKSTMSGGNWNSQTPSKPTSLELAAISLHLVHVLASTHKLHLLIAPSVTTVLPHCPPRLECLYSPMGHCVQSLPEHSAPRCAGRQHKSCCLGWVRAPKLQSQEEEEHESLKGVGSLLLFLKGSSFLLFFKWILVVLKRKPITTKPPPPPLGFRSLPPSTRRSAVSEEKVVWRWRSVCKRESWCAFGQCPMRK